ncbi:MAG: hypothetical protein ACN4GF_04995 [Lentimonas sp.]
MLLITVVMDWQIKTIARKSSSSETPFNPGERVTCLIYKVKGKDDLGRADLLESELENFETPGEMLGRWTRIVKDPDDEGMNARETMASAEDFFFSLFEIEQPEAREESDMLKHLLSLMLERKRVLRAIAPRLTEGQQMYRHVKTKQELAVPIVDISTELMLKIQDTIGDIML